MTTYEISPTGLGTTRGGDGSSSSPFGTWAELDAAVDLVNGDIVLIDPTLPLLESVHIESETGITVRSKTPGTLARVLCAETADVDNLIAQETFDVYASDNGSFTSKPTCVTENWDTNTLPNGNRFGFLVELEFQVDLETARGWWYDASNDRVLVSVESGDNAGDNTYYFGINGSAIRISSPTNVELIDISAELGAQLNTGYGIKGDGAVNGLTLTNCEADGNGYHSMGVTGTSCTNFVTTGCVMRTISPDNDSHWVAYTTGTAISGCEFSSSTMYLDPWIDVDEAASVVEAADPVTDGIKGIACHHGSSADPTLAGGVSISDIITVWSGYNTSSACRDITLTASDTNHSAPADQDVFDNYPVQITDCIFGGHGGQFGGGSGADVHVAMRRCQSSIVGTNTVGGLGGAGHWYLNTGASSNTVLYAEGCTFSADLNDTSGRSIINASGSSSLILENCSLHLKGTYADGVNVSILGAGASTTLVKAGGCVFSLEDTDRRFFSGGNSAQVAGFAEFSDCLYGPSNNQFWQSANIQEAAWLSTYDPDGKYDLTPDFADIDTLEPDTNLKAAVNTTRVSGKRGINGRPYNLRYGAWQYGGLSGDVTPNNSWSTVASRVGIPKFIPNHLKNTCVITRRGWEQKLAGKDGNRGLMEVIVAGNFASPSPTNDAPEFYEGKNSLSKTLTGESGSEIEPYIIEIHDPNSIVGEDSISVLSSSGLPDGLSISQISIDSPMIFFKISGTPSGSGTGTISIVFVDENYEPLTTEISYNIT